MADTGCLASEPVRAYIRAYVRDLFTHYPRLTGIRPDWPEYPCYKLDEGFQDFSPLIAQWAKQRGFDFAAIQRDVGLLYTYVHGSLTNADLESWADADRGRARELALLRRFPAAFEWLRLKAGLSVDLLRHWREVITDSGGADKKLSANAFMPPLTLITGFDFDGAAGHCDAASPKLFTMHWTVMVEFWGRVLRERNPQLDEQLLVRALVNLFDLADNARVTNLRDFHYPEPDEPHPVSTATQQRRIRQAVHEAGAGMAITPSVHGYGPLDDFARRFQLVADSPAAGAWINRYGYLSDEKLKTVGRIWKAP